MGGGSSSPPQFNAQQSAQDQTRSNVDTAVANATLNNTNQSTPFSNLTYNQTGGQWINGNFVPSYTATQTPTANAQGLYDKAFSIGNNLNFAPPPDQGNFQTSAYNDIMSRFNTDFNRTQAQTDTSLRNQGLQPGSEAYNTQMDLLNRTKTDAQQQAEINSVGLGGQLQSQYQSSQMFPLQEMGSLFGLASGNSPYINTPQNQVQPTDVAGLDLAAYQGQLNAYNQQMQSSNSMMGGLFGLGGSALMAGGLYL